MMCSNPYDRLSAKQVLEHLWFVAPINEVYPIKTTDIQEKDDTSYLPLISE